MYIFSLLAEKHIKGSSEATLIPEDRPTAFFPVNKSIGIEHEHTL